MYSRLEKAVNVISIIDVLFCVLSMVYSFIFKAIFNNADIESMNLFDLLLWVGIAVFVLALSIILLFSITVVIRSVIIKSIIKEKRVIIAFIINVIFIAMFMFWMSQINFNGSNLFFIFC